jgi:hypothetical protein
MIELVPYPIPPDRLSSRRAGLVTAHIKRYGVEAVVEQRLREMSRDGDPTNVLARLLRNTVLAFSKPQLWSLVRREMKEITGISSDSAKH